MWYHTTHGPNQGDQESWDLLQMYHSSSCLYQQSQKTKPKIFRRVLRTKGIKTPKPKEATLKKHTPAQVSTSRYLLEYLSWKRYVPSASYRSVHLNESNFFWDNYLRYKKFLWLKSVCKYILFSKINIFYVQRTCCCTSDTIQSSTLLFTWTLLIISEHKLCSLELKMPKNA